MNSMKQCVCSFGVQICTKVPDTGETLVAEGVTAYAIAVLAGSSQRGVGNGAEQPSAGTGTRRSKATVAVWTAEGNALGGSVPRPCVEGGPNGRNVRGLGLLLLQEFLRQEFEAATLAVAERADGRAP